MQKLALAAAMAIVLSGCAGLGGKQLSQDEARIAAQDALAAFVRDFAAADGGALRSVGVSFGAGSVGSGVTFEKEWGTQGTARLLLAVSGGGVDYGVQIFCGADRVVLAVDDAHYEQRRADAACLAFDGGQETLGLDELDNDTIQAVEPHRDGSVTATLSRGDGNVTAKIDAQGRLTRMDFEGLGGAGSLDVHYGKRSLIPLPDATQRLPVLVFGQGHFSDGAYEWAAGSGSQSAPFNDIEVRVIDGSTTVASFMLQDGTQTQGSFTMAFDDDGDGRFGKDDGFRVSGNGWTQPGQYEVLVWDTWADAEAGDLPPEILQWIALL